MTTKKKTVKNFEELYKFGDDININGRVYIFCGVDGENIMGDLLVVVKEKKTAKLKTFPISL